MDSSSDYVYGQQKDREFEDHFGVNPKALQEQGLDPARYVVDQMLTPRGRRKLRNLRPRAGAPSSVLAVAYTGWGTRGYYAMFTGLGFLALSKVGALHWVGIFGAVVAVLAAVYMVVMMWVYRRRHARACRSEGIPPSWRRR